MEPNVFYRVEIDGANSMTFSTHIAAISYIERTAVNRGSDTEATIFQVSEIQQDVTAKYDAETDRAYFESEEIEA